MVLLSHDTTQQRKKVGYYKTSSLLIGLLVQGNYIEDFEKEVQERVLSNY